MAVGKWTRASQEQRCTLCGLAIPTSEVYWRERMTPWDHQDNDGFFTLKAHKACYEFWDADYADRVDGLFPVGTEGEFREAMREAGERP